MRQCALEGQSGVEFLIYSRRVDACISLRLLGNMTDPLWLRYSDKPQLCGLGYSHGRECCHENRTEGVIVAVDHTAIALSIVAVRETISVSDKRQNAKQECVVVVSSSKLNGT